MPIYGGQHSRALSPVSVGTDLRELLSNASFLLQAQINLPAADSTIGVSQQLPSPDNTAGQ